MGKLEKWEIWKFEYEQIRKFRNLRIERWRNWVVWKSESLEIRKVDSR